MRNQYTHDEKDAMKEGDRPIAQPEKAESEPRDGEEADSGSEELRTVFVPRVQNMDDYLIRHYKSFIIQELNKRLVDGEIQEIIGAPVASRRIVPGECRFRRFSYWRLNRCDFLIDIETLLELRVHTSAGTDTDFYPFYLELWFRFCEEVEQRELQKIGLIEGIPDHEGEWELDKYQAPIMRRDEIDHYAGKIWDEVYPEAAADARLRRPGALAEKMHLSIIDLPLYRQRSTRCILFFRESTVQIQQPRAPGEHEDPPPTEAQVPADTIVVNKSRPGAGSELDLYHECIHYEWHYLFYRLQDMHNNDLKQLRAGSAAVRNRETANPVCFMENQAKRGSYALMLPRPFMVETVERLYKATFGGKRKDGYFDHDGWRYEFIARRIADENALSKACVRARMIQVGYTAAIGSLNFVDGNYIVPFAFSDIGSCDGDSTYVIDRKGVGRLYQEDENFRKIMQSGEFAYVDGHVVYCESDNIMRTSKGMRLTGWANAHIDRASLRFRKTYTDESHYSYTFGQLNNKEDLINAYRFLDRNGTMTMRERQKAVDEMMKKMDFSFHSSLALIMKQCGWKVEELAERIHISERTLCRLRSEERKQYRLDHVFAICIGLNLPPWLSEVLLAKAHLKVERTGEFGYYGMILDCFYQDTIEDVQKYLKKEGYNQLDLDYEADDEEDEEEA